MLKTPILPYLLTVLSISPDIREDANCLFRSLCFLSGLDQPWHSELRRAVVLSLYIDQPEPDENYIHQMIGKLLRTCRS